MKLFFLAFALAASACISAPAQTNLPAQSPATPLDPAKVAEYQHRFETGYALQKQGRFEQARTVYDGIIAEQPEAKRSLLEAGRVSLELNQPEKADAYLEKLHALAPDFPEAIELLIQANESLRRDIKAERLVREFRALRDSGKVAGFSDSLFFEREHVPLDAGNEVVISQFFDYTKPPYYALRAELYNNSHQRQRVLLLKYDPEGTALVRKKDPKLQNDNVFILAEPFYTGDRMTKINVYQELMSTPDYNKARTMLLLVLNQAPKPIYSTPVNDTGPAP
jgi:tetratricopeptide (TPR) repeat protein